MSRLNEYLKAAKWDQKQYKLRELKKALKETEDPDEEIKLKEMIKELEYSESETKNAEGLTLEEYIAKVKEILDTKTLYSPHKKGFPQDHLWRQHRKDIVWAWNDDVPVKECVSQIVHEIMDVQAVI